MTLSSPFECAIAELRKLGITIASLPGEYRVNLRNGTDATARTAETLQEAVELGYALAADAPAPPGPARRVRHRRPPRMTPKAQRRRMIRKHNRALRARTIRQGCAYISDDDS